MLYDPHTPISGDHTIYHQQYGRRTVLFPTGKAVMVYGSGWLQAQQCTLIGLHSVS